MRSWIRFQDYTPVNPDFFDFVFGSWLLLRHIRVFFKLFNPDLRFLSALGSPD